MRRFSSEGSLLDLDFLPWKTVPLKEPGGAQGGEPGTHTPYLEVVETDGHRVPLQEPTGPRQLCKHPLTKEHSISMDNLEQGAGGGLAVGGFNEGCRAYSDSQLAPGGVSGEGAGAAEPNHALPSSPSSSAPYSTRSLNRQHARAKLAAAKLHLKSLFGQSPASSQSNNVSSEQRDSENRTRERRSRLPFLRQWSQVGHSGTKFNREELQSWAESLNTLLANRMGVSVFGAFLRSEFSEENLQFYLACEQYRHSSNNFSLQRRARDICATYVQPGASREVNLDSKTRELTLQLLQAPSHTSLLHAQRRIYSLLDTDCYPRFLQSSLYQTLLREAD